MVAAEASTASRRSSNSGPLIDRWLSRTSFSTTVAVLTTDRICCPVTRSGRTKASALHGAVAPPASIGEYSIVSSFEITSPVSPSCTARERTRA